MISYGAVSDAPTSRALQQAERRLRNLEAGDWVDVDDYETNWESRGISSNYEPQYRTVGDWVELRGLMDTTAVRSTFAGMLTLPSGFRPSRRVHRTVWTEGGPSRVRVDDDGVVNYDGAYLALGVGDWVSLDGLFFAV